MSVVCHLAVVGGSGSGKTWLSERLVEHFAPEASAVSLDSFYRDLASLSMIEREAVNFDDPEAIDWEAVARCVQELDVRGETVIPRYDFASHTRLAVGERLSAKRVVVWEGLWLLWPGWLRERFCWTVFIECEAGERLRRRVERDRRERGRTELSVRRQFESTVSPMHERHVEPQRGWAKVRVESPFGEETMRALFEEARGHVEAAMGERIERAGGGV